MNFKKGKIAVLMALALVSGQSFAGNEDRAGSAGATELLINPWARSSAWGTAGISSIKGIESMFSNVAGLAFTDRTEIMFSNTNWLGQISGIGLNSFGLGQRVGESGVIGISAMTMDFGQIPITTTELPEGQIGNFNPKYMNFGMAYAKQFSPSISGGLNMKIISQSISNMRAQGVALDAGIRYVTGENDNTKFAISLRNVGPPMTYRGDGLSLDMMNPTTGIPLTTEQRVSAFELPSQLHIGASYDFIFSENSTLTAAGAFTSNSFTKDQWRGGAEYRLVSEKAAFTLRGGLVYEQGILTENSDNALNGPTGGFSVDLLAGEAKSELGIDYAFRNSRLGPIHSIGLRINLK